MRGDGAIERLHVPLHLYIASAFGLLPTFARLCAASPAMQMKDMKRMVFLAAAARAVERARHRGACSTLLLDEGPIYMLARMRMLRGPALEVPAVRAWMQSTVAWWARELDLIVLLDAPDAQLVRRIRTRSQPPPIVANDDRELLGFLARYRVVFEQITGELSAAGTVRVVRIGTEAAAESVARRIRGLLPQSAAAA
jgi:hypothetical protein